MTFIKSAGLLTDELTGLLDFVLPFLAAVTDESDIYEELARLKMVYTCAVQRFNRYEARLKQSNMETIMAFGNRIGHINKNEVLKKIALIDRICLCVYGRTEFIEYRAAERHIRGYGPDADIGKIIKALL